MWKSKEQKSKEWKSKERKSEEWKSKRVEEQKSEFQPCLRGMRSKVFTFKNRKDLNNNLIFLKIRKYLSYTSKNNRQKENFNVKKNFFMLQNGQIVFDLVNGKTIFV